jgi:hypothetical protein
MDEKRRDYVTPRYPQLQGLRLIPAAFVFLAAAPWHLRLYHLPGENQRNAPIRYLLVALFVAAGASLPIKKWYEPRWGKVTQGLKGFPLPAMVAVLVGMVLAQSLVPAQALPFSLPLVVLAVALAVVGAMHYPYRRHYLLAAAVFAALSLHRTLGVPPDVWGALSFATIGIVLIIVGLGDHRLIATTLRRVDGVTGIPMHV